jgi:hypothetical protein
MAATAVRASAVLTAMSSQTGIPGSRTNWNARLAETSRHTAAPKQKTEKLNSTVAIRSTNNGYESSLSNLGAQHRSTRRPAIEIVRM